MTDAGAADAGPTRPTLLFIQYGAFREDLDRLAGGGEETYQAQRDTVEFIRGTAAHWTTAVLNLLTETASDEDVAGLRVIGLGPRGQSLGWRGWWRLLDRVDPARIVLRTPLLPVLAWAARRRRPVLAVLADSFQPTSLRARLRRRAMRRALSGRQVHYVGNHGRNASFHLAAIGVPKARVIPYDFPAADSPHDRGPKPAPSPDRPLRLLFVGALSEAKGADDVVRAAARLAERAIDASLTMIGGGPDRLEALARALDIGARVAFPGRVAADQVVPRMRAADIVVIPSRHDCPEGLPLTIYAALAARTPIVASDHPMFLGNLVDGTSALLFPAGDADALAERVARLARDAALYVRLSTNSAAAWDRLQLPVLFTDLVGRWLAGDRTWLDAHTLASRDYGLR